MDTSLLLFPSVYNGIVVATTQWIELDGHSLRPEDLMKIGRGEYRVKVSMIIPGPGRLIYPNPLGKPIPDTAQGNRPHAMVSCM